MPLLPAPASPLTGCLQSAHRWLNHHSVSGEGKLHLGCGSSAALTPVWMKAQSDCEELAGSSFGITGADSKAKLFPRLDMQKIQFRGLMFKDIYSPGSRPTRRGSAHKWQG